MPARTDFVSYYRSVATELKATQDRIRNLIGSRHWVTDGEHKEAVLRKVLRTFLPELLQVGRGFICYEADSSTQLDVLITRKDKPTLFKDGDLVLVTPDCVEAIVEVKTKQGSQTGLTNTLTRLADQVQRVREHGPCWVGLFVFDGPTGRDDHAYERKSRELLSALQNASKGEAARVVDCVALGPRLFARYWKESPAQANRFVSGPGWHSYVFKAPRHHGLAPAYFVSNLVWEVSPDILPTMRYAWFPIGGDGGKEQYRRHFIALHGGEVISFEELRSSRQHGSL